MLETALDKIEIFKEEAGSKAKSMVNRGQSKEQRGGGS
jgi:hypothetical protein